jgi:hypothetical protein
MTTTYTPMIPIVIACVRLTVKSRFPICCEVGEMKSKKSVSNAAGAMIVVVGVGVVTGAVVCSSQIS